MTLIYFSSNKLPAVFCSGCWGKDSETWQQGEITCDHDMTGVKALEVSLQLHGCLVLPHFLKFLLGP